MKQFIDAFRTGDEVLLLKDRERCIGPRRIRTFESRNRDWQPRVVEIAQKENAFITVGAFHLFGATGVLNTLEKNGFRVRRIDPRAPAL